MPSTSSFPSFPFLSPPHHKNPIPPARLPSPSSPLLPPVLVFFQHNKVGKEIMMANNSSSRKQGANQDNETPSPPHQVYLNGDQVYTCSGCHTHLAKNDDIISKVMDVLSLLICPHNQTAIVMTTLTISIHQFPTHIKTAFFNSTFLLAPVGAIRASKADTEGRTCSSRCTTSAWDPRRIEC